MIIHFVRTDLGPGKETIVGKQLNVVLVPRIGDMLRLSDHERYKVSAVTWHIKLGAQEQHVVVGIEEVVEDQHELTDKNIEAVWYKHADAVTHALNAGMVYHETHFIETLRRFTRAIIKQQGGRP